MMQRAYYSNSIAGFLGETDDAVLGRLTRKVTFRLETTQRDAWIEQLRILRRVLSSFTGGGAVYLEYGIPRLGKRIDALVILGSVVFVVEFKVGDHEFASHAIDQVYDYALDLKNFHETSHDCYIAPILVPTAAMRNQTLVVDAPREDRVFAPIRTTPNLLESAMRAAMNLADGPAIRLGDWQNGRYCPTPTIIEAAKALYGGHSVEEISKKDAGAENLALTSKAINEIITMSQSKSVKSVCLVTGVPGAGKTLVGLDIATTHFDKDSALYSVFLSGNGPLVAVLREALARDKVCRRKEAGENFKIGEARSEVKAFIQNVHHFRDECLIDRARPPIEHVALFDEAQRAWDLKQTAKFMKQRGHTQFEMSEPEFLISCLDRHRDWAVIVCLVGGGQEINTGEAGISEWLAAIEKSFPQWHLHLSSRLTDAEYGAGDILQQARTLPNVTIRDELHLSVSMRSFRAENMSLFVKQVLDLESTAAAATLNSLRNHYPIVLTRNLTEAKAWLRAKARGNERYGMVVSSNAYRLKPHAIDVRYQVDPVHWFLHGKDDTRSSYYLEDAATEYRVQGLELDWACVTWDADFRRVPGAWQHWKFVGTRWNRVRQYTQQAYLKNAYRVLLTRARQGMVIVVPHGDPNDPTRLPEYYDPTYAYLRDIGLSEI